MEHFMNTSSKRIWKTSDKSEALLKKSGIAWKHEVKNHVSVVAPECHAYKRHVPGDMHYV